jgi:adenosine kinase
MELGKLAAEKNKIFALNLSAPFIAQFFKDQVDAATPYCDYIICNETEAGAYAESHGLASRDPTDLVKHLANLPKENKQRKRVAIVTQGIDPTLIAVEGQDEVKEIPVHAIDASQINDTNGAGDAFAGGFLAGLVLGKELETCVDMGQWLARLSIQELGPSYPMPPQTYQGL